MNKLVRLPIKSVSWYRLLTRLFLAVSVLFFLLGITGPTIAFAAALPQVDKDALAGDWPHWTTRTSVSSSPTKCADGAASGGAPAGPVYLLGDSIGVRTTPYLTTQLTNAGYSLMSDSLSSRTILGGTVSPDGIHAVDQAADRAFIAKSTAIVIELGTNGVGMSNTNIDTLINKVRAIAKPGTKIYWVDLVVIGRGRPVADGFSANNRIIYGQSSIDNFQVISWDKKVLGSSADPLNISSIAVDTNGYIDTSDGLGVHPTVPKGAGALADIITSAVTGNGGGCAGGGLLSGNCSEDQIWNYLSKKGLSQIQIAGLMGNLQAEGGFEPRRVQYGGINSRGEVSVAGQPSSLDDTMRIDGTTGYGIAQWTSMGRQQGLHDLAVANGTIDGSLSTQMDWLWHELTTSYKSSVYDPLKAATDLATATNIVLFHFESPADQGSSVQDRRLGLSTDILNQLSGGGSSC